MTRTTMDAGTAVEELDFQHEDPAVDEALEWFARLRNAAPGADERRDFAAWLARDPRHAEEFAQLEEIWGATGFRDAVLAAAPAHPGTRHLASARRGGWGRLGMALAGMAAAVVLAVGIWNGPHLWRIWNADFHTGIGEQASLSLPDGSTMMLNTASAVSIDFEGGRREVRLLEGEAWFEVQPDPARPFRVTGQYGTVTVTGTKFSLRLGSAHDTVILEHGRVEVAGLQPGRAPVVLAPDQMVWIEPAGPTALQPADPASSLAWRQGRVVFDEQPLAVVVEELQRYRGGQAIVMNDAASAMLVSGSYRLDDIETALRILAETAGLDVTRIPGGILFLR